MRRLTRTAAIWATAALAFQLIWPALASAAAVPAPAGASVAIWGPLVFWAALLGSLSLQEAPAADVVVGSLLFWALFMSLLLGAMWLASLFAP